MSTYVNDGGDLAVDVVNSYEAADDKEHLDSEAALQAFAEKRGFGAKRVTRSDLERIRRARQVLRDAMLKDDEADAVETLNALMAASRPRPRLVASADETWTFSYSDPDAGVVDQIVATAAGQLLEEIRQHGMHRFSSCASETCDDVFVDQSRNHSRRFCSAAVCGNRAAQRAYRTRQAASSPDQR